MRFLFLPSLLFVAVGFGAQAQAQELTPPAAQGAFAEAKSLSISDAGSTWGVPLYGPMLFVDPATRHAIANEPDAQGALVKTANVYSATLPADLPLANTAVEWKGKRWTMVLWPLPQDPLARNRLLAHEMFHRIQPALHISATDAANHQLDQLQGRIWLRLEWRALAAALAANTITDREAAIADALAFRSYRQSLFPGSAVSEEELELSEGLAEYTGVRLSGPDAASARWHTIAALAAPSSTQSFVRSFAYTSGPAYGLLLDLEKKDWHQQLGAAPSWEELLGTPPHLTEEEVKSRAIKYGYAAVLLQETDHAKQSEEVHARYSKLLVSGPTLSLPILSAFHYSFNPNELIPLGNEGMVYPTLQASDEWGTIEVSQGALVSHPKHLIHVAAPGSPTAADGKISGPGWVLTLAPGWKLEATTNGSFELKKQ
ncbi:MAG: hypothetical protein PW735_12775 [Acidobacteriaceae bacterium]|nr:hypothetical protein [Acidobacteriaceae bacterium]